MKFNLIKEIGGTRLGSLALGREDWCTPAFLTSTPSGCIPNLTRETLEIMGDSIFPMGIPYNAILPEVLEAFKRPMNEFMGLPENPFILLLHEGSEEQKLGFFSKESISVWSPTGNRHSVNCDDYFRVIKACQPHAFVALSDSETPKDTTKKRLLKSMSKSLKFLKQIVSYDGQLPPLLVPLGGGYDSNVRKDYNESVLELDQNQISGYVLEGFHTGGLTSAKNVALDEIVPLIRTSLNKLPQNKPRFIVGAFDPWKILNLVENGIDMFESSFPHLMTEKGQVLTFDPNGHNVSKQAIVDLNDEMYKNSFEPVSSGCSCYVCEHHTQAYVHHLLMTNELLAKVILMMHNLHHFRTFFKAIRRSIQENRFQDYKMRMKQYSFE
ncbi:queuine tRNA-ribosyltransferase accessory subunit 2 isoform X1 [Lepeophtheirus salmonis]|uniref:queuine tRNA-ribosyltransferase accessory subunit 2 isoform X1 n=1 Tax=Lepeophtheirus salmonis TaxID=72036 RepID=UPI001AE6777D|nr:queuine tRNA-ribosyltransferase accessory subunit 2-like isoform X1 [Lepeophtheirus salmonis]